MCVRCASNTALPILRETSSCGEGDPPPPPPPFHNLILQLSRPCKTRFVRSGKRSVLFGFFCVPCFFAQLAVLNFTLNLNLGAICAHPACLPTSRSAVETGFSAIVLQCARSTTTSVQVQARRVARILMSGVRSFRWFCWR